MGRPLTRQAAASAPDCGLRNLARRCAFVRSRQAYVAREADIKSGDETLDPGLGGDLSAQGYRRITSRTGLGQALLIFALDG